MFLIKSWWQGVAAFTHLAFFKIHFVLFILSFQTVVCFSVALQTSFTPPDPDLQLYPEHFEVLKTQTLLLCKSFGKNQKNLQEVGVLSLVTDNRRVLQVNLIYFCCSNAADLLYKANSLSCSPPPAHFFSAPDTHRTLSPDEGLPTLVFSVFSESWIQENETHWPNAVIVISLFI